jgi:hypothetical protein
MVGRNVYGYRTAIDQPLIRKAEETVRKMCRLLITESGMRMRRMRYRHVKNNE